MAGKFKTDTSALQELQEAMAKIADEIVDKTSPIGDVIGDDASTGRMQMTSSMNGYVNRFADLRNKLEMQFRDASTYFVQTIQATDAADQKLAQEAEIKERHPEFGGLDPDAMID